MRQDAMTVRQFDPKHRVWQQFDNLALYFNCVFARHVRISGLFLVIKTVCLNCAEVFSSAVRTVQPSSINRTSSVPNLIFGSIVTVISAFSSGPLPLLP